MQSVIFNQTDSLTRFKEIDDNRFFRKYAHIDIEGKTGQPKINKFKLCVMSSCLCCSSSSDEMENAENNIITVMLKPPSSLIPTLVYPCV